MKAIVKPSQVIKSTERFIPYDVILIFNELIKKYWNGYSAIIPDKEVREQIHNEFGYQSDDLWFDNLNLMDAFRSEGWNAEFLPYVPVGEEAGPSKDLWIFKSGEIDP